MCRVYESKRGRYIRLCAHWGKKKGWTIPIAANISDYWPHTPETIAKHVKPEVAATALPPTKSAA